MAASGNVFLKSYAPIVAEIYAALLSQLESIGVVRQDTKRTSIHLLPEPSGSAFAGVHPRKSGLLLTVRTSTRIAEPGGRIKRVEQVSAHRFHTDVFLSSPDELDVEIMSWLAAAFALSTAKHLQTEGAKSDDA